LLFRTIGPCLSQKGWASQKSAELWQQIPERGGGGPAQLTQQPALEPEVDPQPLEAGGLADSIAILDPG
jgi:hypothetical protein